MKVWWWVWWEWVCKTWIKYVYTPGWGCFPHLPRSIDQHVQCFHCSFLLISLCLVARFGPSIFTTDAKEAWQFLGVFVSALGWHHIITFQGRATVGVQEISDELPCACCDQKKVKWNTSLCPGSLKACTILILCQLVKISTEIRALTCVPCPKLPQTGSQ